MHELSPKKAGPLAGFSAGGGGLSWAAEKLEWHWPPAMIYIVAIISVVVFAASGIMLLRSGWRWLGDQLNSSEETVFRKSIRVVTENVVPLMIGAAVLASLTLLAVSIGAAFMYRAGFFERNPPQIVINAQQAVPPPTPPQQAAPIPDPGPQAPKDQLQLTARLIQLTGLIKQANDARALARASGTAIYEWILQTVINDPTYRKPPLGLKGSWPDATRQLQRVNTLFNPNRKMDLEAFPEMNNYSYKPPQESLFGNDGEKLSQYRSYYFLTRWVGKQADALIAQMEEDAKTIRVQITNTAALSALDDPK